MNVVAANPGQVQSIYFGKLPSMGDFVRSTEGESLIHKLDEWMSRAIELMFEDPRWKLAYDAAAPVHFAILGPDYPCGLAGHLVSSRDTSGRRFPFIKAVSFDVPDPVGFMPYGPIALMPLWQQQQEDIQRVMAAHDFSDDLLSGKSVSLEVRPQVLQDDHLRDSQCYTLAQLAAWVFDQAPSGSLRQTLLALGMLLQPVLTQGHAGLGKGLVLPLPAEPAHQLSVMTFWTRLVAPFFKSTSAELAFLISHQPGRPVLIIGFQGASAVTLRTAFDQAFAAQQHVHLAEANWVEEWVDSQPAWVRLSTVLQDLSLSWSAATDVFHEVFLGE